VTTQNIDTLLLLLRNCFMLLGREDQETLPSDSNLGNVNYLKSKLRGRLGMDKGILTILTLNFITSSILACFPSETQLWKNEGATDTPRASDVIPV